MCFRQLAKLEGFDKILNSYDLAASCQALLVVGTSAEVSPANGIPFLKGKAGGVVTELVQEVER